MKEKVGSGKPKSTKALQSLQSQLILLKKKYLRQNSYSSSKNGWDSRVWSSSVSIGESELSNPDAMFRKAQLEFIDYFGVAHQCHGKLASLTERSSYKGDVCLCGHPVSEHVEGGLCQAGSNICFCRRASAVLSVSDTRHFYKATKGPHEAHALALGLKDLISHHGAANKLVEWKCQMKACSRTSKVGPVRMRSDVAISLGLSVHDSHKFMCERCLFMKLNGGY